MEYKVRIKYTEIYYVYVKADSYEEAEDIALDKYSNGDCEIYFEDLTAEVEELLEDTDA